MAEGLFFPTGARLSRSVFDRDRDAFSATDIEAVIYGRDKTTGNSVVTKIGDIQTLTYSSHRESGPVRLLGRSFPRAYTMGSRTVAGTMIFATFNERALSSIYSGPDSNITDPTGRSSDAKIHLPSDTIPPFDIILYFASENGNDSVMYIYRVQIVDEGQTFSIQDVYTEQTVQYVAGGVSLMRKTKDIWRQAQFGEQAIFHNLSTIHNAESAGLII